MPTIHDENDNWLIITKEEASIIYEYYKNQYISYDNQELISIMQAISKFANQNELSK